MPAHTAPYGFWPSDFDAEQAASACVDFAELVPAHGGIYWLRFDPDQARVSLWFGAEGEACCLTPAGFSLRSRVYEYGGGAFCPMSEGWLFVNEADQQIYRQASTEAEPQAVTVDGDCRYGGLAFDAHAGAVLAVEERRVENAPLPEHRLVAIDLSGGERRVIAEGADFYGAPALSADGRQLAWVEWRRPAQPWLETRLMLAERQDSGRFSAPRCVAGEEGGQALTQPRFDPAGQLFVLSDCDNWWKPWLVARGGLQSPPGFAVKDADHCPAPWQLGMSSYLPLGGQLLLSRLEQGFAVLALSGAGGEQRLAPAFSRFRQFCADGEHYYAIAAGPECLPAVIAIERRGGRVRVLAGGEKPLTGSQLSRPTPIVFAVGGAGEQAHAFFYPPCNAALRGPAGHKPPLVVFLHGGPTSACYPVFDPRIQFWTQRGFAVADLNYRGSSGFGRAMRLRLAGEWGAIEVEDACALVRALARQGRIDPERAFIRGASAGGYTALLALQRQGVFRGGASLYGVSDPLKLREATHKFEVDYLDWLIGNPESDAERYAERTPLYHADCSAPVIFFQGGKDRVVVPAQTESMVEALKARGVPVDYRLFPGEGHGFRQAGHLAEVLQREWQFYCRLLISPGDSPG